VRTKDWPGWIDGSGVRVVHDGILVPVFVVIGVRVLVGVLVIDGTMDDEVVDANVIAGESGEGDWVASTSIGEQAVRRKRKITIKKFFKLCIL
jgi:hypothetical protein